jgi:hypothetical protein
MSRETSPGVGSASTITQDVRLHSAHISRLRATPGVWWVRQDELERRKGACKPEFPRGSSGRRVAGRIGQAREFVTTREGLRYKANLAATLRMHLRTEAFAGQKV